MGFFSSSLLPFFSSSLLLFFASSLLLLLIESSECHDSLYGLAGVAFIPLVHGVNYLLQILVVGRDIDFYRSSLDDHLQACILYSTTTGYNTKRSPSGKETILVPVSS